MRVLTLNLHNPRPVHVEGIANFIEGSGAELCVLTECTESALEGLATELGCAGIAHAPAPFFGNGLLTRTLAIDGPRAINLPLSTSGELRSAVVAEVHAPWGALTVLGTHLEHLREADRLRQVQHLATSVDLTRALLIGDFNSLRRSDYTWRGWREVNQRREQARLVPASTKVTDFLFGELGLHDAHDARQKRAPFAATCPYGTRVDYICIGQGSGARAVPGSYQVLDAIESGLTDHNAVLVDLKRKEIGRS